MQQAISFLTENDIVFKTLHHQHGNPFIPSRPAGFETLCKLILEQQVSIESGMACFQKLESFVKQVTSKNILKHTDEAIRNCSISRQKVVYLKALAYAIEEIEIDLNSFLTKSNEQVREELIKIKGIGNWTIDVYLLFSLQSPDIIPLEDIAIVNTIKELYGCKTNEDIKLVSENWKPYRSMATFFL